ncbi:hypothetical protein [Planotetraspora silvatica]|uniref:hypothetical protein n=1 Tax=Planotetraspora silvatica TaxID=234614 RepID=UPI00194E3DBF|nr:hypothetical protein [Planotetraspora silvatica]
MSGLTADWSWPAEKPPAVGVVVEELPAGHGSPAVSVQQRGGERAGYRTAGFGWPPLMRPSGE